MKNNDLSELIYKLEGELLKSDVRKSAERISNYISDDFIEFTSHGKEYHYKHGDVYQDKDNDTKLNWEIKDFKIKQLSNECVLATYKVVKHDEIDEDNKYSLRSSIWKLQKDKWKMIFHQGTLTEEEKDIINR